ncbi:MAG: uncharacterized protein QOH95_794 [Gaiellaceae bacterium]|nr:uncharacterized protein [Gaiellaceae bacterium]
MWIVDGALNAARMAWEVWWALVLGFALSGIVQAWVPRARIERALGGRGARQVALATGLGAASSSCSYAAIAIAKSLFQKGAGLVSAMSFQFASTNLVFELGLVLWLFLGWRFTLAEFVGGIVLILVMWAALNVLVSPRAEEEVRAHALEAETGHAHHMAGGSKPFSLQGWSDVAHNFRGDWRMLWKELVGGFLIAGYVSLLPTGFFNGLFITHAWAPLRIVENVLVGPLVAALAFVCSIGNIPLAAVLWSGGISFGGVIAFIFADLIIVPIVNAYRKYYGARFAALLTGVMFGAMVIAALAVDGLFSLTGLVPTHRPSIESLAERPVTWNYTSVLDVVFAIVFAVLIGLTVRRGAKDPVCEMRVDRKAGGPATVHGGRTYYFCGPHCKHTFDLDPEAYA